MANARTASIIETRWQREPAITLRSGPMSATFLPAVGMTGVSARLGGREFLATPGGLAALRNGHTLGLPLLAPWANRLSSRRFRSAGVDVDLRGRRLRTDDRGLPIHGFLVGASGWRVTATAAKGGVASLRAAIDVDRPAFPFPHRIELIVRLRVPALEVATTVVPTRRRRVPIAFGWHPYLRLPGARRNAWTLRLPRRRHLALDQGLPTGASVVQPATAVRIGRRSFDDLYALGSDRHLGAVAPDGTWAEVRGDTRYPFAQVWVPQGRPFVALEPMTAATNALVDGTTPVVGPGDAFTARFRLAIGTGEPPARLR